MKAFLSLGLASMFAASFAFAEPVTPGGDALADSSITERVVTPENSQKGADEIRTVFPEISRDILTLYTIDRVVLTSNGTLDLYSGETLWMVLEMSGQTFSVRQSAYEFEPSSIEHTMSLDNPQLVDGLDFIFKGCAANQQGVQACEQVRVHLGLSQVVPQ